MKNKIMHSSLVSLPNYPITSSHY